MRKLLLLFTALISPFIIANSITESPAIMLVQTYQGQNVTGWVMSEKLDGVRGYWNGKYLYSRSGERLSPPAYFVANFPPFAIDGELFSERNHFEEIASITKSNKGDQWEKLKLHVFDVPTAKGNLFERLQVLKDYLAENPNPYIVIIEQIPIENPQHIQQFLRQVESQQGEGVILRNPNAPYEGGKRSNQILKLKTIYYEECKVIAHHQGKGQFANVLGAVTCENQRGQFRIGSGFNLQERTSPPPIGTVIRYKYRGLTNSGKPRFATYWRESP